jgi:hypothetical protein
VFQAQYIFIYMLHTGKKEKERGKDDALGGKGVDPHCEKSIFVLSSRQKIPLSRTENPAVDTKTIFPLPIDLF